MQWTDEAIVISIRAHGETTAIVDFFTREHGRCAALVHGGRSRRLRPVLQIGNHVDLTWKARLAEQLGYANVELRRGYAAEAMEDAARLTALSSMAALARLLPERDPHPNLFEVSLFVLSFLDDDSAWPALYARWELLLLDELGFGLDLANCAATNTNDDLIYVSPKSGRAVSASAGEPYRDRLLKLPAFLRPGGSLARQSDISDALKLTGHFLDARIFRPGETIMPEVRTRLAALIARQSG
ncbi:MAG: repair protein RecO [Pseudomonadota bacterium]|jgi:DNA repair protein RecO (recombination protein O)